MVETRKLRASSAGDRGFTLLEIAFAVLILAGSLIVILGLQSSVVEQTLQDKNRRHAMLMARRIMAAIEILEEPLEEQDTYAPALKVLQQILPAANKDYLADLPEDSIDLRFMARLKVTNWGKEIPLVQNINMKRIDLTVSWGENKQNSYRVTYFMPGDEL
ncbi:MAG: hypothetical protein D6719_03830 [Candidatus Dadabacteria bacterium]|nr:MAG: hypothetical protein D6719_03830 [Candidatus Dadabacteria bacterium]